VVERALAAGGEWLEPADARAVLAAYGIPLVPECVVSTPEEAVAVARELGHPVVVKTARAGVHKTELGGVAVDLAGDDDVRAAASGIGSPLLVQPMLSGASLLAGVVQDPGLRAARRLRAGRRDGRADRRHRLPDRAAHGRDARELVEGGKAGELVRGFRGRAPADVDALTDLLHRLARLAQDLPEVAELDLNPVLASAEGCAAVDARVRVAPRHRPERAKSW
jgi:acyl-CoA synthetase (NDP forming)